MAMTLSVHLHNTLLQLVSIETSYTVCISLLYVHTPLEMYLLLLALLSLSVSVLASLWHEFGDSLM